MLVDRARVQLRATDDPYFPAKRIGPASSCSPPRLYGARYVVAHSKFAHLSRALGQRCVGPIATKRASDHWQVGLACTSDARSPFYCAEERILRDGYRQFLAALEIRDGIAEILISASKAASGEAVKELASGLTSELVQSVLEESAKAAVGVIAGPLLKLLLGASDKLSGRLNNLTREPFETDVRAAQQALRLPSIDPDAVRFREERLNFSINQLERAWTLAGGTKTEAEDRLYIRLVQGLCSEAVRGGLSDARMRLAECVDSLVPEIEAIESQIKSLREQASRYQAEHDKEWEFYKAVAGTGYFAIQRELGGDFDHPLANAASLSRQAEAIERQLQGLRANRDYIFRFVELLRDHQRELDLRLAPPS